MKRPKITAGKWHVEKCRHGFIEIKGDEEIVCEDYISPQDAQAIAAIPDMMDALEMALGFVQTMEEISGVKTDTKRVVQAAMKKAGYTFEG